MAEEMCVVMDKKDYMSKKMNIIESINERKAIINKALGEKSLLKKCEKINKSYKFVTGESIFIKEFSDKQEDLKHKSCCYRPKLVLINDKKDEYQQLAFAINVVKQEGKNDTINEIDINSIHTKYYTLSDDFGLNFDISDAESKNLNRRRVCLVDEEELKKEKAEEKQVFKLGNSSLSFDSDGVNFSNLDEDLIRLIYSEMKPRFKNMLNTFKNYIDDDEKFIAVLYSGGKDSTCRVLELLNEGYNVLPLVNTFNVHNVTDLLIRDIAVIHNLYHIRKNGSFKGKLYQPRFLSYTSFHFDHDYMGLNQQPYNVVSLALLGETFYKRCIRIEMCLISGDCGVSYIPEMKRLYNAVLKFNCGYNDSVRTIPPLTFPYIKRDKSEIKDHLQSQLYNLRNGFKNYYVPTCQRTTIRNINLQYQGNHAYLVIRFDFCGQCDYCVRYVPNYLEGINVMVPLKEIPFNDAQNTVLHSENIYKVSNRLANLFSAI